MTIIQADRDAVEAFHSASFTALFDDGGDKQTVGGNINKAHTLLLEAFAAHRKAAEARARLEGAKAMQEAVMVEMHRDEANEDNTDYIYFVRSNVRALDPAQITGGSDDV